MVPGHPPCALSSLIFSSLDPETNCFFSIHCSMLCRYAASSFPLLQDFSWPCRLASASPGLAYYSVSQLAFPESFLLCSCQGAGCFFQGLSPENDTVDSAFPLPRFPSTAYPLTLCVFARPALWPSRSHFHAFAALAAPLTVELFLYLLSATRLLTFVFCSRLLAFFSCSSASTSE